MNFIKITALSLVLATSLSSLTVMAAESAKITIKGSLVPSACSISVAGAVDFGNLKAGELKEQLKELNAYQLGFKPVDFNIQCNSAARVAISAQADSPASAATLGVRSYNTESESNLTNTVEKFGILSLVDEKELGYFTTTLASVTLDGVKAEVMHSIDNGTQWKNASTTRDLVMNLDGADWYSWGTGNTPQEATSIAGVINISAAVDTNIVGQMKDAINFSTNTTLTLHYL